MRRLAQAIFRAASRAGQPQATPVPRRKTAARQAFENRANEKGTTLIEYAFVIGLISLAVGFVLPEILESMTNLFSRLSSSVQSAAAK